MLRRTVTVLLLTMTLMMITSFPATAISDENVRIIIELETDSVIEKQSEFRLLDKEMSSKQISKLREQLVSNQVSVKKEIKAEKIDIDYHYSFVNLINGFSGTASFSDLEKIGNLPGVKEVRISKTYKIPPLQPNMTTSKETVNVLTTWNLGYEGEGKAVAIIDSTVDHTHKDMRLSDDVEMKLTKEEVEAIIENDNLFGRWFSDKVPYGYNYGDNNDHLPTNQSHGMHVAGIVAANTDDETKGIKGVAPEAQLFAMKVISDDDGFMYDDAILKAMDDSVPLKADVINLSLGSTAQFKGPESVLYETIQKLVGNGVVPVIAAGNSAYMGWEYQHPYARNPDIGVVATPGIIDGSLCVASIDNVTMYKSIQFREYKIPYWAYSEETDPLTTFNDDDMQYIDCKEGIFISEVQNDFNGLDIAGKIALIKRGTISFEDKIRNAENLGAAGVIIYNHEEGGNKLIEMAYDTEAVTIPAVFIGNNHGEIMKNAEEIEKVFKFTNIEVPIGGDMSDFTSWGTSPSLDFKPDITAPGGGIYSTLPDNKYAIYSGTSMACPYVAGGTALILQRMEENDYLNLSGIDRVNMVKNLLMSTAHPQEFKDGIEISPRRQGAGLMDLYAAATTNAIITDKITGLSKVNLKETGSSATFNISLTNFGNEDLEYAVRGSVLTSLPYSYEEGELVYIDPDRETKVVDSSTKNMPITFPGISEGTISVSAGTTKEFTVLLDLSNPVCELENASTGEISLQSLNTIFSNGTFIEGFISLTSEDETVPSLSIPYMGFYGNWDQAPIFDHSIYEENQQAFYNMTFEEEFRGTYLQSGETILGIRGDFIDPLLVAISPNGDGEQDDVQAVVELLRNAKEIDIDILNEAKEIVHEFEASEYHVKNYDSDYEPPLELSAWDGKISENVIDGNYIYRVKARIDFEDSQWQTLEFPVRVDTLPPVIESADYNKNEDTITVVANDGIFTGIRYLLHQESKGVIAESESGIFDLGNLSPRPSQVQVMVKDAAANSTLSDIITLDTDETAPIVYLESPENRGFYNNPELSVNGYIVEGGILTSFKVNDNDIDFTYNSEESRYEFEDVISFDDGAHQLEVAAVDNSNNTYTSQAAFFMDTAAPIITMTKIPPVSVSSGTETITISATIDENMGYLEVLLNDDPRYLKEIDPSNEEEVLLPVHYDMSLERVSLEYGNNLVILKAIDKAGNESVNEFKVNRLRPGEGSTTGGGSGGALPLDPSSNSQIVNPDLGQTLSIKGASIELPQGAVGGKVQISVQELSSFSNPPGQNRLLSQVYEFTKDKAGNFLKPVLITLTFNPAEIDRNIHEPVLCWLNELTQQWEVLEDSRFDWDTNTISGSINHFTKFAVLAYPIEIKMIDIEGHWAQENIKKMVNQKIISGYEDNSFRPNNEISRAEFSTMLVKYLNLDHTLELDEESFTDIKAHWAEDYIKAAYASGIVNGYNSTHFGPNDYITREQMAVMIGKAIKIKASSETMTFNDTHRVSPWAASFVAAAVHEELLTGYPDTSFRPKNKTTRAEAVTVISKLEKQ